MIDVLILMFCIFLLMPVTTGTDNAEAPKTDAVEAEKLPTDVQELQKQLAQFKEENKRLKAEKGDLGNRLSVRVLEIDAVTGGLFAWRDREREVVNSQQAAERVIFLHRQASAGKDVYFLILYPREASGYPVTQQVRQYRQWFANVPFGFDSP